MLRRVSLLALVLAAGLAGCDTGTDAPDEERILGTRTATTVNTRAIGGISIPVLDLTDSEPESSVTFGTGGAFRLSLALPDSLSVGSGSSTVGVPLPDAVTITGTYTLDADADLVTVTRTDIGGTLTLRYVFRSADSLELIAEDDDAFGALLGVVAGPEYEALASVIDGGSIRFEP